jgi:hypothetical protein
VCFLFEKGDGAEAQCTGMRKPNIETFAAFTNASRDVKINQYASPMISRVHQEILHTDISMENPSLHIKIMVRSHQRSECLFEVIQLWYMLQTDTPRPKDLYPQFAIVIRVL